MEKETSLKFGSTKDNTNKAVQKPESLAIQIGKVQCNHGENIGIFMIQVVNNYTLFLLRSHKSILIDY